MKASRREYAMNPVCGTISACTPLFIMIIWFASMLTKDQGWMLLAILLSPLIFLFGAGVAVISFIRLERCPMLGLIGLILNLLPGITWLF
jgi:hypothetical protein